MVGREGGERGLVEMNAACRGGEGKCQGRGGERRARVEGAEAKEGNGGVNWKCSWSGGSRGV